MLDFNVAYGIGLAVALILLIRFVFPYLRAKGMKGNIYEDIKMGLLLFGYAFREEKVKRITAMLYEIVSNIEELDVAPDDKKAQAVRVAFDKLLADFEIVLDEEAIELIIDIAVAYLPPTNAIE